MESDEIDPAVFAPLRESQLSRDIRVLSEVEKIWILYDLDESGYLEFDEI